MIRQHHKISSLFVTKPWFGIVFDLTNNEARSETSSGKRLRHKSLNYNNKNCNNNPTMCKKCDINFSSCGPGATVPRVFNREPATDARRVATPHELRSRFATLTLMGYNQQSSVERSTRQQEQAQKKRINHWRTS